jgi:hypothetical protein
VGRREPQVRNFHSFLWASGTEMRFDAQWRRLAQACVTLLLLDPEPRGLHRWNTEAGMGLSHSGVKIPFRIRLLPEGTDWVRPSASSRFGGGCAWRRRRGLADAAI